MTSRVDESGAALAGSQLQTQLYVNRRSAELDAAVRGAFHELDGATIEWRSPLAADGYREYWDRAFLKRVDLDEHADALAGFWPTGGPHWDALGVVHRTGRPDGVVLVEAKSYPDELFGSGCQAQPGSPSRTLIESSLGWTQQRLGVHGQTPAAWCGRLYQTANRLAHLCWLRDRGVDAWLVHALFEADPHGPTTADEWHSAVAAADAELGLTNEPITGAAHVVLPAGEREELLS